MHHQFVATKWGAQPHQGNWTRDRYALLQRSVLLFNFLIFFDAYMILHDHTWSMYMYRAEPTRWIKGGQTKKVVRRFFVRGWIPTKWPD